MHKIPTDREIQKTRRKYPAGSRIELIEMEDPYAHPKAGDQGTVVGVDDLGQILMRWDNGSTLSLIPEIDRFVRVTNRKDE